MIKRSLIILTVFSALNMFTVFSQSDSIKSTFIKYYSLDIEITYGQEGFFNGLISVYKNGKKIYNMDSTFSDYMEHKTIDLDGNGSKELLLYLTDGASPYVFHNLYIFDIKRADKPVYMIQNGDIDTAIGKLPKIVGSSRMSPAFLGLWYNWLLDYKNNMLSLVKNDKKIRDRLSPDIGSIKENADEYYKSGNVCDDYTYNIFFENVFICYKVTGESVKAEEFFYENYKCPNKVSNLTALKKTASDIYKWISDESNYKYSEY